MLPVFGTAAILVAAPAPLLSTGYVAGNTLAAQHFNWYLYHLTKELNNLLISVGIGQLVTDDTQLTQAVGLNQVSISASGTTVASAFKGDTWTQFNNSGGASTYDISAGASRSGVRLTIEETNANGVTIKTGTGMTAALGIGAVHLLWDGTQWCKVGGANIVQVFTSGSGATWKTPWAGSYKVTVTGGGGAGGGFNGLSGGGAGGGGGGTAIGILYELAGATLTYTVGALVAGGNGSGTTGNNSTLTDGTSTLTGNGGIGGGGASAINVGSAGGGASGGSIQSKGDGSGAGFYIASIQISGNGGGSIWGGGAPGVVGTSGAVAGVAGGAYGGGGSGATNTGASSATGGGGAAGVVVIEF